MHSRSGNNARLRVNRDKNNSSTSDALFRPFGSVNGRRRIDGLGQGNFLRRSWCLPVHPTKGDKWDDGKRNQRAHILNHPSSTCRLIKPLLQVEVSELNDLRCLEAAEGYIELGMYDEADAEIAKVNPTCRIFRLFVCAQLISLQPLPVPKH